MLWITRHYRLKSPHIYGLNDVGAKPIRNTGSCPFSLRTGHTVAGHFPEPSPLFVVVRGKEVDATDVLRTQRGSLSGTWLSLSKSARSVFYST